MKYYLRNIVIFFLFSFVFLPLSLHAQNTDPSSGEIININQKYQVAFTDLGGQSLKKGDIVKVFLNSKEFIYLQVLEASSILSKLGPVLSENFKTNLKDFQRLAVGNAVEKVKPVSEEIKEKPEENIYQPLAVVESQPKETVLSNQDNFDEVQTRLNEAKKEIDSLKESNSSLNGKIGQVSLEKESLQQMVSGYRKEIQDLKKVISELKIRIEYMNRIINQEN